MRTALRPVIGIVAAAGVVLAAALIATSASGQNALPASVYPTPGTIAASPRTQISFRGRAIGDIGPVSVRGSRSGPHAGTLRAHSDGQGASWIPAKPFTGGETIAVTTSLDINGARNGDFTLRTARIPRRVVIPNLILDDVEPGKVHRFRTRPDMIPPLVTVSPNPRPTEPGYIFLSPKAKNDANQAGPMIVDNAGRLVYFKPLPGVLAATDVRAQTYKGKPVITWWEGTSRIGIGTGVFRIVDQNYRLIKSFQTPNGYRGDLHEVLLTDRNTAIVIAYPAVRADLRRVKGPRNGQVIDSVIQEIDIDTGLVLFEWHSLGEVPITDTFSRPAPSPNQPFDYFHANSVGLDSDGDFLISARNTWGVYKVDRATGRIEWVLGGKRSSFKLGPGVRFAWQHDARRRADGAITLFDNSAFPPVRKHSRVLAIGLDGGAKTARLLSARLHPRKLLAATQGNAQNLPGGGSFVGWGSQRYMTEYSRGGGVLWDARLSVGYESYRSYRLPWVGTPGTRPEVAGVRRGRAMDVYASWNGATTVSTWEVLGGPSAASLQPLRSAARAGFETRIPVPSRTAFVAVRAKDAAGGILGTSLARRVRGR